MKHIPTLLFLLATCAFAFEMLPLNLTELKTAGTPGSVARQDGVVRLELKGVNKAPFIVTASCPVASQEPAYHVLRGQVKPEGTATCWATIVMRNEKGGWIREVRTPDFTANGQWQDFTLRLYTHETTALLEVNLLAANGGAADFRGLSVEKTTAEEGRPADAPDMEFWINMDYNDDVGYWHNIKGMKRYDAAAIADYFKFCKENGVTGVLWRVSCMGQMDYPTKVGTVYPSFTDGRELSETESRMKSILAEFDPVEVAVREARRNGIQIYIWMTVCDEAYNHPDRGKVSYCQFLEDHPECKLLDREGKPLEGTMSYSEPAAREYRLALVKELLGYKADGIYLCNRTHSWSFGNDPDCDYGFNPTAVAEYQKRYGVDIRKVDFEKDAQAKKQWMALKAEGYDQLIHEASELIHAAGQKLMLGVCFWGIATGQVGANYGKMSVDIPGYLKDGYVDAIVSGQNKVGPFFAAGEAAAFRRHARPGQKLYFWAQMVDYGAGMISPESLLDQAAFFNFYGANGAMYHESINFEEKDHPETYMKPISKFFREH